jgi:hypothetical protein
MGFIKSIFGIFGGFLKAILGVFGIGKKSEFYMELDAGSASAAPVAAAPAAPAPAKAVAEPAATSPAPQPVVAPAPAVAQPAKPAAAVPSFAENYLLGTTTSRRRPGPSLSPFKAMAKQVSPR